MIRSIGSTLFLVLYLPVILIAQKHQSYIFPLESIVTQNSKNIEIFKELQLLDSGDRSAQRIPYQFKNVPTDLKEKIIKYIDFQPDLKFSNSYNSSDFYPKKVNHYLFFLIGKNLEGKKIIIIDVNNNQDFGDDPKYVLDPETDADKKLSVIANVEYYYKNKVNKKQIRLKVLPFNTRYDKAKTPLENELSVFVSAQEHKYGISEVNNSKISVVVNYPVSYLIDAPDSWEIVFKSIDENDPNQIDFDCRYGDTISLYGSYYKMNIEIPFADSMAITKLDLQHAPPGVIVGMSALPVLGKDYVSGNEINSADNIGKYLLIDFWGSWCVPCINAIPDLSALKDTYKHNLDIISIAVDFEKNLPKLKHIISENSMNWQHIMDPMSGENSIFKQYRISAFPSYILISPEGKIIKKIGEGNYRNIQQIVKEILFFKGVPQ